MAGFLVVNPRSGDARPTAEELCAEARRRGIEPHVLAPHEDAAALARAADADALGVAGGDGSLGAVAEVAVARALPFASIPLGTRNHFARDVGFDRNDPIAALDAFAHGVERTIDIGRAGGRVFLNNVSFGVYARLVHRREHHRRRGDAAARARALWLTLRDRHPEPIVLDGQALNARVLLVANNPYELELFDVGARTSLDEGRLHAYVAAGWWPDTWDERSGQTFRVGAPGRRLQAAVDGEPVDFESPVELRIEPLALRVLVPRERES